MLQETRICLFQFRKLISLHYRKKDDCWNTACLNRNCFKEIQNSHKDHSVLSQWSDSAIYGERDKLTSLFDDLTKGNSVIQLEFICKNRV